jgi:hypothetical protein
MGGAHFSDTHLRTSTIQQTLMSWIFFGPAVLIAHWPYAGIAIAATLIATQAILTARKSGTFDKNFFREAPVFAGLLWLIFGFYEMQMRAAMTSVGKPNEVMSFFRLDSIILVPILYLLTAAAIYSIVRQIQRNEKR